LRFSVVFQQVTGSLAFLASPTLDVAGELTFRPTQHTHGEAIFDVYLIDDGEFEPPHINQSPVQSFIITVNKVNFPPNDLILSNTIILEKQPVGTYVGSFTTADLDPEDVHNYALVPGEGSEDNGSFTLDGNDLLTNEEFDFNTKTDYTIRVKTSDGEFSLEKSFNITIEKLIEGVKFANAITPNGDGENDVWELEDIEAFPDVTVFIYDRAGLSVYKSKQGYVPWDGTHNGKALPMGTYYYVIDLHDNVNVYKGTITIIL
jgi:gliding motility-associated-like protein